MYIESCFSLSEVHYVEWGIGNEKRKGMEYGVSITNMIILPISQMERDQRERERERENLLTADNTTMFGSGPP